MARTDHPADDDDRTVVSVCPSCAARARAFAQPQLQGLKVTFVVVVGPAGDAWTAIARRGLDLLAVATGTSEDEALFAIFERLGVQA